MLGAYEITSDGVAIAPPATAKARSLLAYLALRRDETIRREALMNEFWPDAEPTSARNNLKTTLSTIRRTFRAAGVDADDIVEVSRDAVRWLAPVSVDSRDFERRSADVDDERRAAIAIYRGEFLPGDSSEWAEDLRHRLALRFEYMLRRELSIAPTAELAERLLALDPFSDEAYTALIEGALRQGDPRTAQAVYRRYIAALEEIGAEPPLDLATRVGLRKRDESAGQRDWFFGRVDELAEIERLLNEGTRTIVISGISGIGKTALAAEAARRFGDQNTILCASPEDVATVLQQHPGAFEIALGPLTYDEVAVAIRRAFPDAGSHLIQAVWERSGGYPLVLRDIIAIVDSIDESASAVERLRLSRDLERRFETQLHAAGTDVSDAAALLALEPRLDNDDLAVLLDWSVSRVLDARERLNALGVSYRFYAEAALRSISATRRRGMLERIAERLKLHEDPSAKVRVAEHLVELGRLSDAAQAYLEAGMAFAAASALSNALKSVDAGIAALEHVVSSSGVLHLQRQLYILRGRTLYQQGAFVPAVRSLEALIDISDTREHAEFRTQALIMMGHALVRADMFDPARSVAEQAEKESRSAGDITSELRSKHLIARVLRDQVAYDNAIEVATAGYERAMALHEWGIAASFASLITDISRRRLQFDNAFYWVQRQLDAAILGGPSLEAEARHMLGSVKVAVFRFNEALEEFRHAISLLEQHRRRRSSSATPVGQLEWMLHHALAYTYVTAGDFQNAVAESEWLAYSPWSLNSALSSWQALSVTVDARLGSASPRDIAAARAFLERVPDVASVDHRKCLDVLARARVAARLRSEHAPHMLHEAFASLKNAGEGHPDQVHPHFFRLAESARGIDDLLALRATDEGRSREQAVIEAAGPLWGGLRSTAHDAFGHTTAVSTQ
jgi:DNA-binding SARP family transcriptional activator/tetratricopeptide (TPR) repeat protein